MRRAFNFGVIVPGAPVAPSALVDPVGRLRHARVGNEITLRRLVAKRLFARHARFWREHFGGVERGRSRSQDAGRRVIEGRRTKDVDADDVEGQGEEGRTKWTKERRSGRGRQSLDEDHEGGGQRRRR